MTARHGARAALALGLVASLAGNVIAAEPTALGRLVAAWPPLALLVAIELVTRIPARDGTLSALRLGSAGLLAVIAAWVSYWHLVELARAAGEGGIAAHLLPLSVDGLVAVASICLREIGQPTTAKPTPWPAPARSRTTTPIVPAAQADPQASKAEAVRRSRPAAVTDQGGVRDRVRRLAVEHPEWTQAELAAAAGCSDRTVRRHLAATAPAAAAERSFDDEWAELATLVDPAPAPVAEADLVDPEPNPVAVSQEPTR